MRFKVFLARVVAGLPCGPTFATVGHAPSYRRICYLSKFDYLPALPIDTSHLPAFPRWRCPSEIPPLLRDRVLLLQLYLTLQPPIGFFTFRVFPTSRAVPVSGPPPSWCYKQVIRPQRWASPRCLPPHGGSRSHARNTPQIALVDAFGNLKTCHISRGHPSCAPKNEEERVTKKHPS